MTTKDSAIDEFDRINGVPSWAPISTAPKDGTRLLLWSGGEAETGHWSTSSWVKSFVDGKWTEGAWIVYLNRSDTVILSPTHWMPLPEGPK